MRNYDVYFEIYGKRMKARILAESEEKAKQAVMAKIQFHKVEKSKEEFNQAMDFMDAISNFLNSK